MIRWGLLAPCLVIGLAGCGWRSAPAPEARQDPTPNDVRTLVEIAERSRSTGDFDAAILAYRDALGRTPWNERLSEALATTYAERAARSRNEIGIAGLRAAEADLREARRLAPKDATFSRNLAVVLSELAARLPNDESRAIEAEVAQLAPDLAEQEAPDPEVERVLDFAYALIERGEIDGGIQELETLRGTHPERSDVARLLAQAHVRRGTDLSLEGSRVEGAGHLDRAVAVYTDPATCSYDLCSEQELKLAHHNRIVAWLEAERAPEARRALEEAESLGFAFDRFQAALARLEGR